MISPQSFYNLLKNNDITFFAGVPDSLLKDFCAYISDNLDNENNIITSNEGAAIALGTGYHIATNKIPLIYMQNSGQGNTINPLTSLTDPQVYSIPQLLLIGWRGEPGVKDEPQHIKQGKVTISLLEALNIPYKIVSETINNVENEINEAITYMKKYNAPYALIIRKGLFEKYKPLSPLTNNNYILKREKAIEIIIDNVDSDEVTFVATTGKTGRELFEIRKRKNQSHEKDFLTVGCMGHASQIALGKALNCNKEVYCLDGDGSFIMHMGSLSTISQLAPKNFKHIILNNLAHESVGGQPTAANKINIPDIAKAMGYNNTYSVENEDELNIGINLLKESEGPSLLEIKIALGSRDDLGRPTSSPIENKRALMEYLKNGKSN